MFKVICSALEFVQRLQDCQRLGVLKEVRNAHATREMVNLFNLAFLIKVVVLQGMSFTCLWKLASLSRFPPCFFMLRACHWPLSLNSVGDLDSCQISRIYSRRKPQRESKGRASARGMPQAQWECLLASRSRIQICPACTVSKYRISSMHVCCQPKKNVIYFSANFKALLVHENTSRCGIEEDFAAFSTHLWVS